MPAYLEAEAAPIIVHFHHFLPSRTAYWPASGLCARPKLLRLLDDQSIVMEEGTSLLPEIRSL